MPLAKNKTVTRLQHVQSSFLSRASGLSQTEARDLAQWTRLAIHISVVQGVVTVTSLHNVDSEAERAFLEQALRMQ